MFVKAVVRDSQGLSWNRPQHKVTSVEASESDIIATVYNAYPLITYKVITCVMRKSGASVMKWIRICTLGYCNKLNFDIHQHFRNIL